MRELSCTIQNSNVLFLLPGNPSHSCSPPTKVYSHLKLLLKWHFLVTFWFAFKLGCLIVILHCTLFLPFMLQFVIIFLYVCHDLDMKCPPSPQCSSVQRWDFGGSDWIMRVLYHLWINSLIVS
jgi:hypothetical protein